MEEKGRSNKRISRLSMTSVLLISIAIVLTLLTVTPVIAQEEAEVTVTVNAPEYVEEKETFDVTIDVDSITNFTTGLFDLTFDRSVVKVTGVEDGEIDGTEIPVESKTMERDTITVFPNLPSDTVVSGSGYLAKISFKVKGDEGDESVFEISNGFLGGIADGPIEISAEWIDAELKVGAGEKEEEGEEPPEMTPLEPMEKEVSSIEGESMTFEIEVDQEVDISWQINGSEVQTEEGETESDFTKSADAGTWNVSAIATNTETRLSTMHTWIWSVTSTATEASEGTPTPTPTLAPGVTPSPTPTLAPGETPLEEVTSGIKPTPEPTAPPKPAVPGFEAIFAIAAMSGIAYILLKTRRRGKE